MWPSILIIKGFVKHFRTKMSDIKSERRFDDSMYFELDNDNMESSERRSLFIWPSIP